MAFAVMLVLVQVGLFLGLLDNASITIQHFDAEIWVASKGTPTIDFAHEFPATHVQRVRSVPGVARADNLIVFYFMLTLPSGAQETIIVYAMDDFRAWDFPWKVVEGNVEDLRRGPYLMLDSSAEKRFGPFQVGDYREFTGRRLKIIGRTREAVSFTTTPIAFMDHGLAQSLQPALLGGNTNYIVVKLQPGADPESVRAEIQRRLPFNEVFAKQEWSERSRRYWVVSTGLGLNMYLTVFLGCLVGVMVVAQTLYTSTMEHLKEFGTLKAIGGSNADIYRILIRQATICALIGFVLALGPSFAMGHLVQKMGLKLIIPPTFIAAVFVGTVVLCLLSAMLSFRKVARIDPALVFRT